MSNSAHARHIRLSAEERELDCVVQSTIFEKLADGFIAGYKCEQRATPGPLLELLDGARHLKLKATSDPSVVEALDRWKLCLRARITGGSSNSACIEFYLLALPCPAARNARLLAFDDSGRTYLLNAPAPSSWPDEDDFMDVPISHAPVLGSSRRYPAAIGHLPAKYGTVDWHLIDERSYLSHPVICWTTGVLIGFTAISLELVGHGRVSFGISTVVLMLIMVLGGLLVVSGWLTIGDMPTPRKIGQKVSLISHLCATLLASFLVGRYTPGGWLNPRSIISLIMLILAIVSGTLLVLFRNAGYNAPESIDWS